MCFNETASFVAFSTGMLFCGILYLNQYPVFYISMLFFITIMQLVEYFTHKSITVQDAKMNELCTKFILITLFIQPVAYCYMGMYHPPAPTMHNTKFMSPLMIAYCFLFIFMYLYFDAHHLFKTTYLKKCETVCRLKWFDLKGKDSWLGVVFIFLYMALMLDFGYDPKFKYRWGAHFVPISLVVACIYSFTVLKSNIFAKFSYMGSLWCFLSVVFGPVMLLTYT